LTPIASFTVRRRIWRWRVSLFANDWSGISP
jgi:hypothetical protein